MKNCILEMETNSELADKALVLNEDECETSFDSCNDSQLSATL
jgi:hypothetical protein